jgi:hypothetical protein
VGRCRVLGARALDAAVCPRRPLAALCASCCPLRLLLPPAAASPPLIMLQRLTCACLPLMQGARRTGRARPRHRHARRRRHRRRGAQAHGGVDRLPRALCDALPPPVGRAQNGPRGRDHAHGVRGGRGSGAGGWVCSLTHEHSAWAQTTHAGHHRTWHDHQPPTEAALVPAAVKTLNPAYPSFLNPVPTPHTRTG